ncbi:hypothetical protein Bca101_012597 [Brassica carinata]
MKFAWIEDRKKRNIACQQRMKMPMGRGSVYLMDEWIMEPSVDDDEEDMETYEGERSKSGGADHA